MRLIIFDVDGTLIDSQLIIHQAMCQTFTDHKLTPPQIQATRSIIGLTLNLAIAKLLECELNDDVEQITASYKRNYYKLQHRPDMHAQLFEGADEAINTLSNQSDTLLAIATGKSRRGLDFMLDTHDMGNRFVALRTADDCPSKPHPAMVLECCELAGCAPSQAVMVGDSSYDMEMAVAAGARALGVSWGYQATQMLEQAGAHSIVNNPNELVSAIDLVFEGT